MKKVGLIGFGTIGSAIYKDIVDKGVEVKFIYTRNAPEDETLKALHISTPAELEEKCKDVDLVIEAAIAQNVLDLAPIVLKHADFMGFSLTAFAEPGFKETVEALSKEYGHAFHVPHGAILGLDGIFDGRSVLEKITIITTKKPKNLGRDDKERTVLYEGPTRGACVAYPRNVNVHAAVAMAGLGMDKTYSQIISDPNAAGNTHKIIIEADGCNFSIDVLSKPVSGVTGAYTPVSACGSVEKVLFNQGIVIA